MTAPSILLLTEDDERRRQWAEMLAPPGRVIAGFGEAVEGEPIDVIVTDRAIAPEVAGAWNRQLARGEIAVVAIASPTPADVSLPRDFTPRELRLACLLLSEIVRLRRERREHARARKVLSHLALSDPLTGLSNRRAWDEELASRWRAATTERRPLCLALFDVDHFKRVNETRGHAAGDAVLKSVAQRLAAGVRPGDCVARLGGDEFALLVLDSSPRDALALVERVRRSLTFRSREGDLPEITASAGFTLYAPGDDAAPGTAAELFQVADQALRQAKAQGRDRTVEGRTNDAP